MLAEVRSEVHATLVLALPGVPLWDVIPEDVNELPCVVVGRPSASPTRERVVFDLVLPVFVIGRRQKAGQAEDELTALADSVFTALGGTKGVKTPGKETVAVARVDARMLSIAGVDCPAYTIEVEASATTCL